MRTMRYYARYDFVFFHFQLKNKEEHRLSALILIRFHKQFSIHYPLVPILTHQATKEKHGPSLMRHQVLENIISEYWLDFSEPSRSHTMRQVRY